MNSNMTHTGAPTVGSATRRATRFDRSHRIVEAGAKDSRASWHQGGRGHVLLRGAAEVLRLIDRFEITSDTQFALTSRLLGATLRLLHPQIAWLLFERDRLLRERQSVDPSGFSEDPSIEVTSTLSIDLDAHIAAVDAATAVLSGQRPRPVSHKRGGR
jgi:hypothetical protein